MNKCLKLLTVLWLVIAATLAHGSAVNWTGVCVEAAKGDATPALDVIERYTAICLSTDAVAEYFGSSAAVDVKGYLQTNFDQAKLDLAGGSAGAELLNVNEYGLGQYSFLKYTEAAKPSADYFAVVFYENGRDREFCVFDSADATFAENYLCFDDSKRVAVPWQYAALPEPTGGLLLLLGLAALGLRRPGRTERSA